MRPKRTGTSRRPPRLPAAQRRWLTRQDIVAEWPISYNKLASIPPSVLPCVSTGKSKSYDRVDVDALFERLKIKHLSVLIQEAIGAQPKVRRGRPRKRPAKA
ncbi:MAG: hypothetical protein ACM3W4_11010 [Ignavibacteriales bacterium]